MYLNDGEVRVIQTNFAGQRLDIVIEGDIYDHRLSRSLGGNRFFTLHYREVSDWDYKGQDSRPMPGDGDHLFDEILLLPDGLIQHRMYFRGESEITVRFRDFSIGYTDTVHSPYPEKQYIRAANLAETPSPPERDRYDINVNVSPQIYEWLQKQRGSKKIGDYVRGLVQEKYKSSDDT